MSSGRWPTQCQEQQLLMWGASSSHPLYRGRVCPKYTVNTLLIAFSCWPGHSGDTNCSPPVHVPLTRELGLSPSICAYKERVMGAHSKKDVADHMQLCRHFDVTSSAVSVISAKPSTVFPSHGSWINGLHPRVPTYFFHCSNKVFDSYFLFLYSPSNSGTYALVIFLIPLQFPSIYYHSFVFFFFAMFLTMKATFSFFSDLRVNIRMDSGILILK